MNIAFSAILALVLLIPGLLLSRVRRCSGEFSEIVPTPPQPFSVEIAASVIWAGVVHAIVGGVTYGISRVCPVVPPPNLSAVLMLLIGRFGDHDKDLASSIGSIADYPYWVLAYFLISCGTAVLIGRLLAKPIERACRVCRFMDGRDMVVEQWRRFFNLKPNDPENAFVTAVVEMGGASYLFLGILRRLHFHPHTAELERLELHTVAKRRLDRKEAGKNPNSCDAGGDAIEHFATDEFEDVFGNQFLLRMSEIKTLNVVYVNNPD